MQQEEPITVRDVVAFSRIHFANHTTPPISGWRNWVGTWLTSHTSQSVWLIVFFDGRTSPRNHTGRQDCDAYQVAFYSARQSIALRRT